MSTNNSSRPRYKFFLRKLIITPDYATSTLKRARQKRVFFSKVENELIYESHLKREPNYSHFIAKKTLNYLTTLDLTPKKSPFWLNTMHNTHHLKTLKIRGLWSFPEDQAAANPYQKVKNIILYLRNSPKKLRAIELCTSAMMAQPRDIFLIYQKISYLRQLKSYATSMEFLREAVKPVEQEFRLIERKMARLKHLKDVEYDQMINNQRGLLSVMRKNKTCPKLTSLAYHLCGDALEHELRGTQNRDTVMPFFRFHLFPNLIKLNFDNYFCIEPLFDKALGTEFAALKNLKELTLLLTESPRSTNYLFEALASLPQLRLFSLNTETLSNTEWKQLGKFITQQKDLENLSLTLNKIYQSPAEYKQQNKAIESLGAYLRGKTKLTAINLGFRYNSLESISRAFAESNLKNQVKKLRVMAFDDPVTYPTSLHKHVEGLCGFIEAQKESLEDLLIELPYVNTINTGIMHHIGNAISFAKKLTSLSVKVNLDEDGFELTDLNEFIDHEAVIGNQAKKADEEVWPKVFFKALRDLTLLEDFTLQVDLFHNYSDSFAKEYAKMMGVLPSLPRLRYLCFQLPEHKSLKKVESQIILALKSLKNARYITFGTLNVSNRQMEYRLKKIRDAVEVINLCQSQKFDILSR